MAQQPALGGQPAAVAHQSAVLTYDAVARNHDRQVVSGDQPSNLPGVKPSGPGDIVIRPGFPEPDFPDLLVYRDLGGRKVEPVAEIDRERHGRGRSGEVGVQPSRGPTALAVHDVQLGNRSAEPYRPSDPVGSVGELHGQRPLRTLDDGEGADR